jgi:phosphate acetyltransferase
MQPRRRTFNLLSRWDPDIPIAPDPESRNILGRQLSVLANADSAGMVLGAKVLIILTSRPDGVRSRIAGCAMAVVISQARRKQL